MPRLFVAVRVPPDVADAAALPDLAPWRVSRADTWHLTLAFLGEVDGRRTQALRESLESVQAAPITIACLGAIPLPQPTRPRVLALRVVSGERELSALAAQVRLACRDAGAPPVGSGFLGHVTIARGRPAGPTEPWLDRLAGVEITWRASEFSLIESRLGAGAGGTVIHQTLQDYQLRPPSARSRAGLASSR